MTGRKAIKVVRKRTTKQAVHKSPQPNLQEETQSSAPAAGVRREQPPPPQLVRKIIKADNEEARTLKNVFKSNPDTQMKEFIKKAVVKPGANPPQAGKPMHKTPAENHPAAVAQELLDTDDDVADNLAKIFKVSKSYKNI